MHVHVIEACTGLTALLLAEQGSNIAAAYSCITSCNSTVLGGRHAKGGRRAEDMVPTWASSTEAHNSEMAKCGRLTPEDGPPGPLLLLHWDERSV